VIANFSFLERHVESINVAVAWTVGFAWTNLLSMVSCNTSHNMSNAFRKGESARIEEG
jgi:hypothetical protein